MDQSTLPIICIKEINEPITSVAVSINATFKKVKSANVVGMVEGKNTDSCMVVCAHYDHLGRMGKAIFRGANDNASGSAFMLGLVKHFAQSDNKPPYNIIFIAFGAEEVGLIGSSYFVQNPLVSLKKMCYVLNFDLLGNGENGVMAVGALTYSHLYQQFMETHAENKSRISVATRTNAPNSDHWPFTQKGVPALFFYTQGGAPHYHDVYDCPDQIKLPIFYNFMQLIIKFLNK